MSRFRFERLRQNLVVEAKRVAREPFIRLFVRTVLMLLPTTLRTKALWEIGERPQYLLGVLSAAQQARLEGIDEIAVIEFGVAGGNGLIVLQKWARAVEKETGVRIAVYGFDSGEGLPETCGDYRDHPDKWAPKDYPMDIDALRKKLDQSTQLIIGDARDTVRPFVDGLSYPIGFCSVDVDLYSSTKAVLAVFSGPNRRVLRRTYLYFDDVADPQASFLHRFAGELLAIDEFNQANSNVKIDRWRGLRSGRIFQGSDWIEKMYIAHDLEAISASRPVRAPLMDLKLRE